MLPSYKLGVVEINYKSMESYEVLRTGVPKLKSKVLLQAVSDLRGGLLMAQRSVDNHGFSNFYKASHGLALSSV